jgi:hypothetical protein
MRPATFLTLLTLGACGESPVAVLPPLVNAPAELVGMTASVTGQTTAPYIMLELVLSNGFSGFVAVNSQAQPVWYFRTQGGPMAFTRLRNGNFVFLDSARGLVEVNVAGQVVAELAQQSRPGRRIHHDVAATALNTVLFIADDWHAWHGKQLQGDAVWEWYPSSGLTEKRWTPFNFLDPDSEWSARSLDGDWFHANSLSIGARGNVLLSSRFFSQVISIAPGYQSIEWRLGGLHASVAVDDPFSGQHTAQDVGTDRILLFDNGLDRTTERYSRAAEYQVTGGHAAKIWDWRPPQDNWATAISSARRLSNGHTVIGFGLGKGSPAGATGPIEVYEVTEPGRWCGIW